MGPSVALRHPPVSAICKFVAAICTVVGDYEFNFAQNPNKKPMADFGKIRAKWKPEGATDDVKSLWETKEKSGNETGQTIHPNAPSIFLT